MLNLGLSMGLARPFGLAGVAIGTAIPNVLFAVAVLVVACRELGIAPLAVPRATSCRGPRSAPFPRWRSCCGSGSGLQVRDLPGLVAAGLAMVVLFAVVSVFYVYRDDPYVDLRTAARAAGRPEEPSVRVARRESGAVRKTRRRSGQPSGNRGSIGE